jgi:hypothetical protein
MLSPLLLAAALLAAPVARADVLDLTAQARTLAGVVACAAGAPAPPARLDAKVLAAHCRQMALLERWWRKRWLARAQPFLEKVVPADVPETLVYPFGGGDLLTALVTFPRAKEITTLSLEPAGDVRAIETIDPVDLDDVLTDVRQMTSNLFAVAHSKTSVMRQMSKAKLPGEVALTLIALAMNDLEPVVVRYFRVGPTGELAYVTSEDVEAASGATARAALFANIEIEYAARADTTGGGEAAGGRIGGPNAVTHGVFRHVSGNLDDVHLTSDPALLRHLEAKGPVAAMTKAASYLLWSRAFSEIRGYLLGHMVWMISDSTGIPPEQSGAAGFEQIPYGHFEGPFLKAAQKPSDAFQKLWGASVEPISFRFGYPDVAGNSHLLITRHPAK